MCLCHLRLIAFHFLITIYFLTILNAKDVLIFVCTYTDRERERESFVLILLHSSTPCTSAVISNGFLLSLLEQHPIQPPPPILESGALNCF